MFSYQGSCRSFFATALIFYHKHFALSRTFLFFFSVSSASLSVSFKRQLIYFITSGLVCQQLFSSFSVESFVGIGLISQPFCSLRSFRLRVSGRELCGFLAPVLSDRCYLTTSFWNCQRFFYFLFISDNSNISNNEMSKSHYFSIPAAESHFTRMTAALSEESACKSLSCEDSCYPRSHTKRCI